MRINGDILFMARKKAGLSLVDVGKRTGLMPSAIANLERGGGRRGPLLCTTIVLCDLYNISVYALIGRKKYSDEDLDVRTTLTKANHKLYRAKRALE